jgi:hypothetical protein
MRGRSACNMQWTPMDCTSCTAQFPNAVITNILEPVDLNQKLYQPRGHSLQVAKAGGCAPWLQCPTVMNCDH